MKTYILVDTLNMAFRAKNVVYNADIDTQIGMSFHIIFNSLAKVYRMFEPDNVVACFEGRSWRKNKSAHYKANRKEALLKQSAKEQENSQLFLDALNEFQDFLKEKTNVTVLRAKNLEADDLISIWINEHPDDQHIIISSDSDFVQLLANNVVIYDGVKNHLITLEGTYDDNMEVVIDKKTKQPKKCPEPEWHLFYKCIRGDASDNVFPAYPGAREKSSKKSVGMREAFEDRDNKGFAWNNFMLTRWTDENNTEVRVLDRYLENLALIDLNKQPEEVIIEGKTTIREALERPTVSNVGFNFLKFCSLWNLKRISDHPDIYAKLLNIRNTI